MHVVSTKLGYHILIIMKYTTKLFRIWHLSHIMFNLLYKGTPKMSTFANSEDPDEMLHKVCFSLSLSLLAATFIVC